MRSIEQVNKKIKFMLIYVLYYIFGSTLLIVLFSIIYTLYGCNKPFIMSWEIFWQIKNEAPQNIMIYLYMERIINNLFSLMVVGNVLTKFLSPLNPILFSKYVTYDTVDRIFMFKYWIILPRNQFLYNVKIKLLLTEYETHQKGIDKIKPLWELNSEQLSLNLARGIRYIELSEIDSSNLFKAIDKATSKHLIDGKYIGGEWGIDLYIDGESGNGTNYHNHIKYKKDDLLIGYRFISIQRHQYSSEDFYREKYLSAKEREKINYGEDFYKMGKKEFFRYQHFDKVYRLINSVDAPKANKHHDILTREQIEHGQYKGIRQINIDLASFITWFYLESNRKISWIIKKLGEYLLYITHIKRGY